MAGPAGGWREVDLSAPHLAAPRRVTPILIILPPITAAPPRPATVAQYKYRQVRAAAEPPATPLLSANFSSGLH